ncbi:hypothetical protein H0H93_003246 [Arthromyces matolae]|nr:hypothetical protein H0H93_003246 [Arthromyces matolae]
MSSAFYYEPFYTLDRLLDDAFTLPSTSASNQLQLVGRDTTVPRFLKPRMDLHEDTDKNTVTATFELPGMNKEDVSIDVHDGRLTISGETKSSTEHNENGYAVRERKYGKFSRTLRLPAGTKEEDIKAKLDNGVLSIEFPKVNAEESPRKITIA